MAFNKFYECNNTHCHTISEKPINADYSALSEKLRQILYHLNLKLMIESELLNTRTFVVDFYTENWSKETFVIILCWKLILGCKKWKI